MRARAGPEQAAAQSAASGLWPYHLANGVLATILALACLGAARGLWIAALGLTGAVPLGWILLALRARARGRSATARTPLRRAYVGGTLVLASLAWCASVAVALLTLALWAAFRPRDQVVERHEQPGLGTVLNRSQVEPEFGDGGILRNRYAYLPPAGGEEQIGVQVGEAGRFASAPNLRLRRRGDALEFVCGALVARRRIDAGGPRWIGWVAGAPQEVRLLQRLFPPVARLRTALGEGGVARVPLPVWRDSVVSDAGAEQRTVRARFGERADLELVYRRRGDEWELDREEALARNPRESTQPFPRDVRGELAVFAVEPAAPLLVPDPVFAGWDELRAELGVDPLLREPVTLGEGLAAGCSFAVASEGGPEHRRSLRLEGAWAERGGEVLVFFWLDGGSSDELRAQGRGAWVRVDHVRTARRSWMTFLRLEG